MLSFASEVPTGDQLRHVRELSEIPQDSTPKRSAPTGKTPPPILISGGLPPVPAKLVAKIQEGSFVEMAELLTDTLIKPHYGAEDSTVSSQHKPKEVANIMDWIQCFGVFIAVVSLKEPHRIPDLIGYQNLIVQSSFDSQEGRWIIYDRRFRLKASATTIPQWSSIDITEWRMAFPERPPVVSNFPSPKPLFHQPSNDDFATPSMPVCLEWNENPSSECLRTSCRFRHVCYRCVQTNIPNKKHKAIFCPYKQKRSRGSPSNQGSYRNS